MHLRRALLLFAIVLGLSALAASLTPAPDRVRRGTTPTQTTPGGDARTAEGAPPAGQAATRPVADGPAELRFVTGEPEPRRRRLGVREHAVVTVASDEPGQVAIEDLGLLGFADPAAPAQFDILPTHPGRYEVVFRPIEGEPERVGVIVVGSEG